MDKSFCELLDFVIFLRKKFKLNGSPQKWYQMKDMGKTREKSLINMGSRVDHLAVGPISKFLKPG